ncbi:unnamed protein product, partial [Globisporangium polare]
MPDVAYMIRGPAEDNLTTSVHQTWAYEDKPFRPCFVAGVDTLADPNSRLEALDRKMRHEFFPHGGVQLAWLVDPHNRIMYEYTVSTSDEVVRVVESDWDGGDALPGFQL